jgi:hypothetical protein
VAVAQVPPVLRLGLEFLQVIMSFMGVQLGFRYPLPRNALALFARQ